MTGERRLSTSSDSDPAWATTDTWTNLGGEKCGWEGTGPTGATWSEWGKGLLFPKEEQDLGGGALLDRQKPQLHITWLMEETAKYWGVMEESTYLNIKILANYKSSGSTKNSQDE